MQYKLQRVLMTQCTITLAAWMISIHALLWWREILLHLERLGVQERANGFAVRLPSLSVVVAVAGDTLHSWW